MGLESLKNPKQVATPPLHNPDNHYSTNPMSNFTQNSWRCRVDDLCRYEVVFLGMLTE